MQGRSELEVLLDDATAVAAAKYGGYHAHLRELAHAQKEKTLLKEEFTGIELREWQNQAVLDLDEYFPHFLSPSPVSWTGRDWILGSGSSKL